jgi:hypothetical protein
VPFEICFCHPRRFRSDRLTYRCRRLENPWSATTAKYSFFRSIHPRTADCSVQAAALRKLASKGMSIRGIMIETNLGMQTVRTILDREDWTDRASKRRLEKIDHKPLRDMMVRARARKRTRDALPG